MPKRPFHALAAFFVVGQIAVVAACSSSSGLASPVECGPGAVTCTMDSICCPSAAPFFCGGPIDPNYRGCYPSLQAASAVCGMDMSGGHPVTLSYQCL
jgi:hypothetical protein